MLFSWLIILVTDQLYYKLNNNLNMFYPCQIKCKVCVRRKSLTINRTFSYLPIPRCPQTKLNFLPCLSLLFRCKMVLCGGQDLVKTELGAGCMIFGQKKDDVCQHNVRKPRTILHISAAVVTVASLLSQAP